MNKEQQKDEIILIVKSAIGASTLVDYGWTDKDNEVDNVAEEIADDIYEAGYRKTFTSDFASDTQKAFKEGYLKGYKRFTKWEDENAASVDGTSPIDRDMAGAINRLAELEDKIESGELVSKEWHDEQVLHAESEIDRLEKAIKDSDERIYDLTEQANAKMERLQKEMADILLCVRYSKGGDFDLKKYKRRVVERFAEKLKKNFDGRQTCYVYSDGYTSIGGEINEEIVELLKEYEK